MSSIDKRFPIYSKFIRLYPASYRKDYGEQMLQTLADMIDDPEISRLGVWLRTSIDLPLSLAKQNLLYAGNVLAHDMPVYVKRSSLLGALLLTPFFTFVALDSITSHSIYSSWFWHPLVVATWLIFMPAAAVIIVLSSLLKWLDYRYKREHVKPIKSLLDIAYSWPMLVIAVLGTAIIALAFFHDSVHCVVHNPVNDIRYWHTTLRCIQTG